MKVSFSLAGRWLMHFWLVMLQVISTFSPADQFTWDSNHMLVILFVTLPSLLSTAVLICVRYTVSMLLAPVAWVSMSFNGFCALCCTNSENHLHLTLVIWWISHSSCSNGFGQPELIHFILSSHAVSWQSWSYWRFMAFSRSALCTTISVDVQSLKKFLSIPVGNELPTFHLQLPWITCKFWLLKIHCCGYKFTWQH